MNHKKLLRLYREENLRVRRRRGRKRAMGTRAPMTLPQGPNQRWSLDFVSDTLISGGASASWRWSTTSRASAWRWWSTPRCQARVARELDAIIAARACRR
jgi:putative transposase